MPEWPRSQCWLTPTYNIVVSVVSVFMKLNSQNNIFEVPVVPKKPEPEKRCLTGLRKQPPLLPKAHHSPQGVCLPSAVELWRSSRRDGCSTWASALCALLCSHPLKFCCTIFVLCQSSTLCLCILCWSVYICCL